MSLKKRKFDILYGNNTSILFYIKLKINEAPLYPRNITCHQWTRPCIFEFEIPKFKCTFSEKTKKYKCPLFLFENINRFLRRLNVLDEKKKCLPIILSPKITLIYREVQTQFYNYVNQVKSKHSLIYSG